LAGKFNTALVTSISPDCPSREKMEPAVRIELTTHGLQNRCSTAELSWLETIENKAFYAVIFAGFLGACILNLYMVCFFSYENDITITD
jgi:hypothetical protein